MTRYLARVIMERSIGLRCLFSLFTNNRRMGGRLTWLCVGFVCVARMRQISEIQLLLTRTIDDDDSSMVLITQVTETTQSTVPSADSKMATPVVQKKSTSTTSTLRTVGNSVEVKNAIPAEPRVNQISFVEDVLCTGCRLSLTGSRNSPVCGKFVYDFHKKEKLSWEAAGKKVAKRFNQTCALCDPDVCQPDKRRYWRLDHAAPKVEYAQTHILNSIPEKYRMPRGSLQNVIDYVANENNTVAKGREYLVEFNPTVIRLPESQMPVLSDNRKALYLAAYRVANRHSCFSSDYMDLFNKTVGPYARPKHNREFIGFALLDAQLNILEEVVTNVQIINRRFEDPRLVVLGGDIYIGSFQYLAQIWVTPPKNMNEKVVIPAKFPGSLEIVMSKKLLCTKSKGVYDSGKNLAYFTDAQNRTMLEHTPMLNIEPIDLNHKCRSYERSDRPPGLVERRRIPSPTFGTVDELFYDKLHIGKPNYTGERGSACCVEIDHPATGEKLLVGISHSKTRYRMNRKPPGDVPYNTYFSSFYAMKATEPYDMVALTGKFCFGFRGDNEDGGNPFSHLGFMPMWIGKKFECPRIHYVSSMIEKADDPSKLVISYGVSDCSPRFIVVSKSDVAVMLFTPQEMRPR